MQLQNLAVELLEAIVDQLPYKKDRRSLWRVSRLFRKILARRVFETLTIRARDNALHRLDSRPYDSLDANHPLGCLQLVKRLHLKAPFLANLDYDRCPHWEFYDLLRGDTPIRSSDAAIARMPKLASLFSQLQDNTLVGLSWDLGMCIPQQFLGREGYLTRKQTTIETLSLITVGHHGFHTCGWAIEPVVLCNFPRLREFCWKGVQRGGELDSLRSLFASNHRILEDLELDFFNWGEVVIDERLHRDYIGSALDLSFTDHILPHYSSGKIKTLRSLRRLALSSFGFEFDTRGVTQAFNIPNLRSLKLHNCPGILTFMTTIVNFGLVLQLKSVELIMEDVAIERDGVLESPLIGFLQSFEGLEELYLMLPARWDRPDHWPSRYWEAILHHSSTLRKLIYHERTLAFVENTPPIRNWEETWVDNPLYKGPSIIDPNDYKNHYYNVALAQMQLDCLGIADPQLLAHKTMATSSALPKSFKLLHIRRTPTDIRDWDESLYKDTSYKAQIHALATHNPSSWSQLDCMIMTRVKKYPIFLVAQRIFRSPKFENLQILAFGDFSHGGRYKWSNLLLCRAVTPNPEVKFRVMSTEDVASYERSGLLNMEFLSACPRNHLIPGTRSHRREFP